jgi:hypothetical protein
MFQDTSARSHHTVETGKSGVKQGGGGSREGRWWRIPEIIVHGSQFDGG